MNHILAIIEFIEKVGMSVDNLDVFYQKETESLLFYGKEHRNDENFEHSIEAKLDLDKKSVTIVEVIRHEYNFQSFWKENFGRQETYNVEVTTNFAKWIVKDNQLIVYTATVFQTTKENTLGERIQPIIEFHSMTDFLFYLKISTATLGSSFIPIEKKSFLIPKNYKITEGLSQIKDIPKEVVLKK